MTAAPELQAMDGSRGAFAAWEEMRVAPTFYPISTTYAMPAITSSDRAE